MRSKKERLGNQDGVATTEFIIVSLVFVLIFAVFVTVSNTILFKMKSLITVRNVAFNWHEQEPGVPFKTEVMTAFQTPSMLMDKCLLPYFGNRPSRIKAQVELKVPSFYQEFIPVPEISDQFQIARDTWKEISPIALGSVIAGCAD